MLPQIGPDLLQRLGYMITNRMFGDLQPVRNLGMGKPFFPDQLVDLPALSGQLIDGFFEEIFYFVEIPLCIGMICDALDPSRRIILQFHIAGIPLDVVERSVGRHLVEIGAGMLDRRELLPVLPQPHKDILDDLLRPTLRLQQPGDKRREAGGISKEQDAECSFIVGRDPLE